jgi:hypothetical protein
MGVWRSICPVLETREVFVLAHVGPIYWWPFSMDSLLLLPAFCLFLTSDSKLWLSQPIFPFQPFFSQLINSTSPWSSVQRIPRTRTCVAHFVGSWKLVHRPHPGNEAGCQWFRCPALTNSDDWAGQHGTNMAAWAGGTIDGKTLQNMIWPLGITRSIWDSPGPLF